jgi:predicted homoserine dehydrogenase-like protein
MNLSALCQQRMAGEGPVRAGLIGAGKFGSMFLAQVPTTLGLEVSAIADLDPDRARASCRRVGWDEGQIGATAFLELGAELAARDDVDVVIEATGNPIAGTDHALAAICRGQACGDGQCGSGCPVRGSA